MTTRAPLRVAVVARAVLPLHGLGGLERHVDDLVRHLARSGVEVVLVTPPPARDTAVASGGASAAPERSLDVDGVRLEHVPYLTFPLAGRRGTTVLDRVTAYPLFGERAGARAARLVARDEVDVVHALGAAGLGYARRRLRAAPGTAPGAPFVLNPQGLEEFGATDPTRAPLKRLLYRPLQAAVRTSARAADRVIATDESLAPVVRRHLDLSPDRVAVIPNAVDLERLDAAADPDVGRGLRAAAALSPDDAVLLSVGRIEENKGFQTLAEALAALALVGDLPPAWRWVLVGAGPYRPALERTIARLGLGDHVTLAGRVGDADLHGWYETATLFVHPTHYEGSSLVTLEAMAHRRAVVATEAGGLPDKVRPGRNGWLVAPGDAPALAGAVAEALRARTRLPDMGREGRAIVEREFAWKAVVRTLLALYDELRSGAA